MEGVLLCLMYFINFNSEISLVRRGGVVIFSADQSIISVKSGW